MSQCIDNTDLRDASVDEAKLDAALVSRLADMEARIAALEAALGGHYGIRRRLSLLRTVGRTIR